MSEDFIVLGKITDATMNTVQYLCRINEVKWYVPDDMDNIDRQKVQAWIDDGNPVKDLTAEEAGEL